MPTLIPRKKKTRKRDRAKQAVTAWATWKLLPKKALAIGGGAVAAVGGALALKKKKGKSEPPSYTPPAPPPAPPTSA